MPLKTSERSASLTLLAISAQLAILLVLVWVFAIEPGAAVSRILPLLFVGFLVHATLPMRYRLQFFLLLSAIAIVLVLGPAAALLVFIAGLALIAIAHLPVAYGFRVLLLLSVAIGLAAVRLGWGVRLGLGELPKVILPVLGSMFMFRMVIYLYDLRHEERDRVTRKPTVSPPAASSTLWAPLAYFFLLPNVCFLLFPIVDFRTFRRTYYDSEADAIYRKGLWLIWLGFVDLLLYRLVYHYVAISPGGIEGIWGVARFTLGAYLVYIRVVGQFHLIIGILCLFGFNLPPAHRFFFLATGFTDFWRRARIDWKDFMVKVFYYPMLVPWQRRFGRTMALVLATGLVFVATWLLHAVQWLWLRGEFRLSVNDAVFWAVFGTGVLLNSLLEARESGKRASRTSSEWNLSGALAHALKVMGMFIFICVSWSYWSSPAFSVWLQNMTLATESGVRDYALFFSLLLGFLVLGVAIQFFLWRTGRGRSRAAIPQRGGMPLVTGWRNTTMLAGSTMLLIVALPVSKGVLGSPPQFASILFSNRLNEADQEQQDRGYYERLLDEPRSVAVGLTNARFGAPQMGVSARETENPEDAQLQKFDVLANSQAVRSTHDFLRYELLPSYSGALRAQPFLTNRWGMHDKEYDEVPAPGTYRIALVGTSYEMASGVPQDKGFEAVVEDSLNRVAPPGRKFEILNFSVGGYSNLQNVVVTERKVLQFKPDLVIYALHSNEAVVDIRHLVWAVVAGRGSYPYVEQKLREARVRRDMPLLRLQHRLVPVADDLVRWSFRRMVELCRERGIRAVALEVPRTDETTTDAEKRAMYVGWAKDAGFAVLSLGGAYGSHPLDSISISRNDRHPNVLGHKLLAERFFTLLKENQSLLQLGLARSQ